MKLASATILTRIIILFSALGVVWLNTHFLGTEGQGTASLISLGILLIQSLSHFIGGGAVVYLTSRMQDGQAFWPALIWSLKSSLIFGILFSIVPIVPSEYVMHVCILGFLQSVFTMLQFVCLGKERISVYNTIAATQSALITVVLFIAFTFVKVIHTDSFVVALYISFGFATVAYAMAARDWIRKSKTDQLWSTWKNLFQLGKFTQGGNVLHLLNQRLNFVYLENLWISGRSATGVLSVALYLAEAVWTISKSLSVIQYARISNSRDEQEHHRITRRYLGLSMLAVSGFCLAGLLIPSGIYTWIFTEGAHELKYTFALLVPGILCNGASIIFAHYFSGRGQQKENMIASGIGLVISTLLALVLIPLYGLPGAAISTSSALVSQCAWFVVRYYFVPPVISGGSTGPPLPERAK